LIHRIFLGPKSKEGSQERLTQHPMGSTGRLASPGPLDIASRGRVRRQARRSSITPEPFREFEKSKKGADDLAPSPVEARIGWPVIAVGWVIASRRVRAYGPVIAQPRGVVAGIRRRAIAVI
jgi:hypothetical protein